MQKTELKAEKVMGVAIFHGQPAGTRVATWDDFRYRGKLILNKPYLIRSRASPGIFEGHRTRPGFTRANCFGWFLENGRVYVFENSLKS